MATRETKCKETSVRRYLCYLNNPGYIERKVASGAGIDGNIVII